MVNPGNQSETTRRGILAGGSFIVDQVKIIDVYPQPEQLANISHHEQGTGGAPYNVLLNLAAWNVPFPLFAAGLIGDDALGEWIQNDCRQRGIDTHFLTRTASAPTSYTDVMTERHGGRRTFFHHRGANALWDGSLLAFSEIPARIFHVGYLLLLDALDAADAEYGTGAARLLAAAQEAGMKTSIDVVSEDSDRFQAIVIPTLTYVDYCIINEIEAGKTCGLTPRRSDGSLDHVAVKHAARELCNFGVRDRVIIHFPEGAFAVTADGTEHWQPSLHVPMECIRGTAGAGDAFCAGALLGIHEGWEPPDCLEMAVSAAAASLAHPTCTGGLRSLEETRGLARQFGFRSGE